MHVKSRNIFGLLIKINVVHFLSSTIPLPFILILQGKTDFVEIMLTVARQEIAAFAFIILQFLSNRKGKSAYSGLSLKNVYILLVCAYIAYIVSYL